MTSKYYIVLIVALSAASLRAAPANITVQVDKPGIKVSPTLFGIFFEDINCSADGGLYAEMVRNRSLEDSDKPDHWSFVSAGGKGDISIDSSQPESAKNPHSLKLTVTDPAGGRVGVANEGYWGMAVKRSTSYKLSFDACPDADFKGPLTVSLEGVDGDVYATKTFARLESGWKNYSAILNARGTDTKARLVISTTKPGTVRLDMVSLFPEETWKNRPNGLRPDLAGMLADLKPGFVRFPGGCWVEGEILANSYRWKQTIGDISERRTQYNLWKYYATHGLGFHEYLQLCEDLGAEPLFVINCGMSHKENVPLDQMPEYVQDALDAIEYCNGPADSKWGSVRAKNGHPASFNLKFMEIGNENGGPAYNERYPMFYDAIKAKYPKMNLVANFWAGGIPKSRPVEIMDEHYYDSPEWFINNANHYDNYSRTGPKVYIGEYAVTKGIGLGNLRAAVAEAAFMTGMERNSDVVVLSSYAPLFVNVNQRSWSPDLINYDTSRVFGTPSYYVQGMFSRNRGDAVLPVQIESPALAPEPLRGAVGVGTWRTHAEYRDIKVTRNGQTVLAPDFANGTKDWNLLGDGDWQVQNGILRQNRDSENVRAVIGDKNWTDYTFSLKARKLGGNEGFLILAGVTDENETSWWNIGGWGNTQDGLEIRGASDTKIPNRIETGRWYDLRVELKGPNLKCYLDGKLEFDVNTDANKSSLFASATRKNSTGDIILKVVNVSNNDLPAEVKLDGATGLAATAAAQVLSSEKRTDENTLDAPINVAPVAKELTLTGSTLTNTFPANSVTVIRIKSTNKLAER